MAKHRAGRTVDELIELKMLEKFETMFKPPEPKKDEKKPKLEFWKMYIILIAAYPIIAPLAWGLMKMSQLAMLNLANLH